MVARAGSYNRCILRMEMTIGSMLWEASVETFDRAEQAYLTYVAEHPNHYILNVPRTGSTVPITIHVAECWSVSTSKQTNYTTTEYFKIAFPGRDAAIAHARVLAEQRGIGWQVCQLCKAEPKQRSR